MVYRYTHTYPHTNKKVNTRKEILFRIFTSGNKKNLSDLFVLVDRYYELSSFPFGLRLYNLRRMLTLSLKIFTVSFCLRKNIYSHTICTYKVKHINAKGFSFMCAFFSRNCFTFPISNDCDDNKMNIISVLLIF